MYSPAERNNRTLAQEDKLDRNIITYLWNIYIVLSYRKRVHRHHNHAHIKT